MLGWELPPNNSGGLGVACLNLAKSLSKNGVKIDFVVPYLADHSAIKFMNVLSATNLDPLLRFGGAYNSKNIIEKIIPNVEIPDSSPDMMSIRDVQKAYINFIEKYLLEGPRPDLIHAHDWLTFEAGVLAKKSFGIPFIAHVHATEFDRSGMNGGNSLVHEIEREGLTLADKIFAVSEATKNLIHQKYDIPLEKIDVLYNSLDESFLTEDYQFKKDAYPYLKKKKAEGFTIVSTVGRFTVQKGLVFMLHAAARALKRNPKLLFLFAGDGEEKNQLISLSAKLGISKNVIFTGFIRGKKLRDIYSVSDIFVMSSVSEPFGLTALEAAHHGDVLILTKQSGVAEILKSAFLYDYWDEEKLSNEILAISSSEKLKETLRQSIKNEYNKLSWDDVAKSCLKTYKKLKKKK